MGRTWKKILRINKRFLLKAARLSRYCGGTVLIFVWELSLRFHHKAFTNHPAVLIFLPDKNLKNNRAATDELRLQLVESYLNDFANFQSLLANHCGIVHHRLLLQTLNYLVSSKLSIRFEFIWSNKEFHNFRNKLLIMSFSENKSKKKKKVGNGFLPFMLEYRRKEIAKGNEIDMNTAQLEAGNLWSVSLSCFETKAVYLKILSFLLSFFYPLIS